MHLSGEADIGHRGRRIGEHLAARIERRVEPALRIGLRPARPRRVHRVPTFGNPQDPILLIDQGDLDRRGAEIDPERGHD